MRPPRRRRDPDFERSLFWLVLLTVLGAALLALFGGALGPVPVPERLADALAFGGTLVFLAAAWRATTRSEVLGLVACAGLIGLLVALGATVAALFVTALVGVLVGWRWRRHGLLALWGALCLALVPLATAAAA